jgi:hypothetical protein
MARTEKPQTTASSQVARFIQILREHQAELGRRYHVKSLGLFGSYARGEQKPESALDVLVEFDDVPSLFEFIRLENELTALAGVKVDLVMKDNLKPAIGKRILREIVPV